ncbi:MAG: DUF1573 domain-containing protein [Mariprofundaceae bacterium]|nr:DUF1573 domain-containing protein [Mariprofundaceae bacterium]
MAWALAVWRDDCNYCCAGAWSLMKRMTFIHIVLWLLLMAITTAGCADEIGLRIHGLVLDPVMQDLGDVKEGKHVFATLLIRNNTQEVAQIIDVIASCGCTEATPDQTILAAGEFTVLNIDIDTTGKTGRVKKNVVVTDQAGRQSTAWMTLTVLAADPHTQLPDHGIFDGACARCHVMPAQGKVLGKEIFAAVCAMCHGAKAQGAYAPKLTGFDDVDTLKTIVSEGLDPRHMPGFAKKNGGPLTPKQIHALVKWLMSLD